MKNGKLAETEQNARFEQKKKKNQTCGEGNSPFWRGPR